MTPVRLEPAAPRSRVKYSTTEPLRFHPDVRVMPFPRRLFVATCLQRGKVPGPEVIKLEYSLKLKIKRNDWPLADT